MRRGPSTVVVFALAAAVTVAAQDAAKVDPAHYKVLIDNASVRVLQVNYPAGATSKLHQHPDAVVVALSPANMQFAMPDGKKQDMALTKDQAMYAPPTTHTATNAGKTALSGIMVEFKAATPGTAALPTERPNMKLKTLAEGARANAYLVTAEPGFAEPAGTKHDFDQVVIPVAPMQMSLSIDGKPAKTSWKAGEAAFIGRGQPHESKNTSGKPVDIIIVAIK